MLGGLGAAGGWRLNYIRQLESSMNDHTGIIASNFEKSKAFYVDALAAIGRQLLAEFPASTTGHTDVAGHGEPPKPNF